MILLMQRVTARIRRVHSSGWMRSIRILMDRGALGLLQKVYGFHPWHAAAPLSARPYRKVVADLVASVAPPAQCVVEVGCGLGGILSLVRAPERYGYDVDGGAIRAARLLHGRGVTFVVGDMTAVSQPRIDVLILVNWIHDFAPQQLERWLEPLLCRTKFLLLDAIDPDSSAGYRFAHDFAFLEGIARRSRVARADNEGRSFLLYEVYR